MTKEKQPAWAFNVRGEATPNVEIDIYDVIGQDPWGDGTTTSAKSILAVLRDAKDAKNITVRINSAGGEVTEGMAIYSLLKDHPANVTVQVDALAASIASIVAMAGDEIVMAENAFMMIHNPWGFVIGEAKDMRQQADLLDKMRGNLADIYVARTGQPLESVIAAIDAETWMTAAEALDLGYATKVIPLKAKKSKASNAWNLTRFTNVPPALRPAEEPKIDTGAVIAAVREMLSKPVEVVDASSHKDPAAVGDAVKALDGVALQTDSIRVKPTLESPAVSGKQRSNMNSVVLKLGLLADASEADIVVAIDTLQRERDGARADVASFVAMSGKQTAPEARGVISAAMADVEALRAARAEVERLQKNAENGEAKALIDSAQQSRKVVPATRGKVERLYLEHGLDALKSHLDALVPVAPSGEVHEARPEAIKAYEKMSIAERAALRSEGPLGEQSYKDLRSDWIRRGSPRA